MARFEGSAAHSPDRLRHVARIIGHDNPIDHWLTPTERKSAVEAINFALSSSDSVTKFLGGAPAEEILKCGCAGCEHIKSHLSELRKVAHR